MMIWQVLIFADLHEGFGNPSLWNLCGVSDLFHSHYWSKASEYDQEIPQCSQSTIPIKRHNEDKKVK